MPLRSRAQAVYLKANNPEVFKKFVAETPQGTKLPEHVTKPTVSKKPQGMIITKKRRSTSDGHMTR